MRKTRKETKRPVTSIQFTFASYEDILKKTLFENVLVRVRPGSMIYPPISLPDYLKEGLKDVERYPGEFLRITREFSPYAGRIVYRDNKNLEIPSKAGQCLDEFLDKNDFKIIKEKDEEGREYIIC